MNKYVLMKMLPKTNYTFFSLDFNIFEAVAKKDQQAVKT